MRIARAVGGKCYTGTVAYIWSDDGDKLYRINYDDGDLEDLTHAAVTSCHSWCPDDSPD